LSSEERIDNRITGDDYGKKVEDTAGERERGPEREREETADWRDGGMALKERREEIIFL
jgi:hypothetical protein